MKQLTGISYTLRFLVVVHCTFARRFNESPNSLSLRTLICNTIIEGHPNFLQNIFLCCWNDLLPFLSPYFFLYSILGQQFPFKHKHRGVVPVHGPWSRFSKTSHLKLKREVSRTEKRFKIAIMFSGRRRRSREERNGFVKADVVK